MQQDLEDMSLDKFCDHIESKHHAYIRNTLRSIEPGLVSLVETHGLTHPNLRLLLQTFSVMADKMSIHIQKEGNVLFPYIKKLALYSTKKDSKPHAHFSSLSVPVQRMEHDHSDALKSFKQMRSITNDYSLDGMSDDIIKMFSQLIEFETYVKEHVEIENNILFRRAINLEADLYDTD